MKQISIISADAVFARMLSSELERRGYNAIVSRSTGKSSLIILDLDSGLIDDIREMPCITFSSLCPADLKRPFAMSDIVKMIDEQLGETSHVNRERKSGIMIDKLNSCVVIGDKRIHLSEQEYVLFDALFRNADQVVSKAELTFRVWNGDGNDNRLRVYIKYLRDKLEDHFGGRMIYSIRNEGYIMKLTD